MEKVALYVVPLLPAEDVIFVWLQPSSEVTALKTAEWLSLMKAKPRM